MQSDSPLDWKPLNRRTTIGIRGLKILAVRADGKGYYGRVIDVNPEYLELENGSQKQMLRFFDSPTTFTRIEAPNYRAPKLAERELFGKDNSNGR